jgi:hypothetical protein
LARMVALWATLTRASTAPLMFFKICPTVEASKQTHSSKAALYATS